MIHYHDHLMILIKYDTEIKPVKVFLCNPTSLQNENKNLITYTVVDRDSNTFETMHLKFEASYLNV